MSFLQNLGNSINDQAVKSDENIKSSSQDKNKLFKVDILTVEPILSISRENLCPSSPIDTNGNLSNLASPIQDEQTLCIDNPSSELFYDFQAENFHAEQVISLIYFD